MQIDKLESALRNADAAGDTEAAKQLANALRQARSSSGDPAMTSGGGTLPGPEGEPLGTEMTRNTPELIQSGLLQGKDPYKAALLASVGAVTPDEKELADIAVNLFPELEAFEDEQGNVYLREGEKIGMINKPGPSLTDAIQVPAMAAAFTPSGRVSATTLEQGLKLGGKQLASNLAKSSLAAGGTQGIIEGAQSLSGGEFNPENIAGAAAVQPLAQMGLGKLRRLAVGKNAELIKQQELNRVRDEVLSVSKKHGYRVPPSQVNPSKTNQILEGSISGEAKTAQSLSKKNQNVTNRLAKRSIGLKENEPLTYETLDQVRKEAGKVYDKLSKYTDTIRADIEYANDILSIARPHMKAADSFGGGGNQKIVDLGRQYYKQVFSPEDAVKEIKKLRARSKTRLRSLDNPEAHELGMVERDLADAIESALERDLKRRGDDTLMKEFRDARKRIAKAYTVEDALNPGSGNVNAQKLASMLDKPKGKRAPLEGELRDIAKFASTFRSAAQEPKRSMSDFSVFDLLTAGTLAGGGSIATGNPAMMALAALPAARPAVRGMITSKPYQSLMTNPNYNSLIADILMQSPKLTPVATSQVQ